MPDELSTLNNTPGWLVNELARIVQDEQTYNAYIAHRQQRIAAQQLGAERKSIEGLGRVRMEITPEVYWHWQSRYPGCWKDKDFLRTMERDNDCLRVKCGGTKLQVGYGHLASGGRRKFAKSYG